MPDLAACQQAVGGHLGASAAPRQRRFGREAPATLGLAVDGLGDEDLAVVCVLGEAAGEPRGVAASHEADLAAGAAERDVAPVHADGEGHGHAPLGQLLGPHVEVEGAGEGAVEVVGAGAAGAEEDVDLVVVDVLDVAAVFVHTPVEPAVELEVPLEEHLGLGVGRERGEAVDIEDEGRDALVLVGGGREPGRVGARGGLAGAAGLAQRGVFAQLSEVVGQLSQVGCGRVLLVGLWEELGEEADLRRTTRARAVVVEPAAEGLLHLEGVVEAVARVAGEGALEDRPQRVVDPVGAPVPRVGHDGLAHQAALVVRVGALEQAVSDEHLPEHGTGAEQVGAVVDRIAAHLLGAHVGDLAGAPGGRGAARCVGRGLEHAGHAEVDDLHVAVEGEDDVVGADVAVDEAHALAILPDLAVGMGQPAADLGQRADGDGDGAGAPRGTGACGAPG